MNAVTLTSSFPATVQPGIPKLVETPAGWTRAPLGQFLREVRRPTKMADDETYKLVTVKRARGGVVDRGSFLGRDVLVKSQFKIEAGDFLISKRQIVHGACGLVPNHLAGSIVSNEYAVLNGNDDIDTTFLNYLAHSIFFQQTCFHSSIGVHVEKMIFKLDRWLKFDFNLPPLPEQRKIADILSTWDAAIEKTEALLATAKAQKRALMQSLLTGKRRFPAFEGQPWKEVQLGELGSFKKGKGLPKTEVGSVGKFQCVLYGELYTTYGEIIDQPKSRTDLNDGIVSVAGDVLIPASTTTSGIDLAIASCVMTDGVRLGGDINIFRCKTDTISGAFLAYFLAHARRHEMARFAQGVTIIHLKGSDLLDISISVPPKAEQAKILAVVRGVEDQIAAYRGNLEKLRTEKKALMQQLLTGKRRVTV